MTAHSVKLSRRRLLCAGTLAVVTIPFGAACSKGYDAGPDPLTTLFEQARSDTEAATALARSSSKDSAVAQQVADARAAHADALKVEIDRLNRPKASTRSTAPVVGSGLDGLKQRLANARKQAEELLGGQPRYRAGLVGAIAAGCAGLQRLAPGLGPGENAPSEAPSAGGPLPLGRFLPESTDALQQALAAEHAAVWTYGLVSAFLPGEFTKAVSEGSTEHIQRRDLCERVLSAAAVPPVAAETAYVPPQPVTDEASAKAVIAIAEADSAAGWRGVLERTDDLGLRTMAAHGLIAAARRGTPWRREAGQKPTAVALPGQRS